MFNQNPRSHQKNKDNGMYVEPTQPPLAESGLGWEKHQLPRDEREEGENPPKAFTIILRSSGFFFLSSWKCF